MPLPVMALQDRTTIPAPHQLPPGLREIGAAWADLTARYHANCEALILATHPDTAADAQRQDDAAMLAGKPATATAELAAQVRVLEARDRDLCAQLPPAHDDLMAALREHREAGAQFASDCLTDDVAAIRAACAHLANVLDQVAEDLRLIRFWDNAGRFSGATWNPSQGSVEIRPNQYVNPSDLTHRLEPIAELANTLEAVARGE